MTEILKTNRTARRACILYEFMGGKPVFEAYRDLCHRIGDDVIEYREFDYCFYQFAKGNKVLDQDISSELTNSPSLYDMPMEVAERIVENLDSMDRMVLRKVSESLRFHIDQTAPSISAITVEFLINYASILYDQNIVHYNNQKWYNNEMSEGDCLVEFCDWQKIIHDKFHYLAALDDLSIIMSNPKLRLKYFQVSNVSKKFFAAFVSFFERLPAKIHVENLKIFCQNGEEEFLILPYVEREGLDRIHLDIGNDETFIDVKIEKISKRIEKILKLEQTKGLEMLKIGLYFSNLEEFPLQTFVDGRCQNFALHFKHKRVQMQVVLLYIEILLKSPDLQLFHLSADYGVDTMNIDFELLNNFNFTRLSPDEYSNIFHFSIPNSKEFFYVDVDREEIHMQRVEF
ncbi:hypothetical protein CRE_19088 [Caenorhabditis remanei]|uniref:F-box domain-containing protein n=1 Tax=Caenorhabditis remanei TaxID=31234 RepID=E3LJR3_CAERE|nr:hypothetical protein CRE_19088 [Caenorhabditis remanei]